MNPDAALPWIRNLRPDSRLRLLCLPHAGGGSVEYRAWPEHFPGSVEVCPIVLAGREHRLSESPHTDLRALARELAVAVAPVVRAAPYAVYGHSMGGWVAFELIRALRRLGEPLPVHLFVGARRAPHLPGLHPSVHDLPEPEFLTAIQEIYGALPEALLSQPRILRMFLPALRADFTVLGTYEFVEEAPVPVPITAFVGTDDVAVDPERVKPWKLHTTEAFALRRIPGGHFFLRDSRDLVCDAVAGALRGHLRT